MRNIPRTHNSILSLKFITLSIHFLSLTCFMCESAILTSLIKDSSFSGQDRNMRGKNKTGICEKTSLTLNES